MSDYPPNMTLRPLVQWPREETRTRTRAPFRSGWGDTMNVLHLELRKLGNDGHVWSRASFAPSVLQIALREQDFRRDGLPRASAIPTMPGVILHVESNKGPLSFPCDKFDRWQDNLRAIALGLQALRKVDRYGITPGNEQYRGWQAIESKPAESHFTADTAERFLWEIAGAIGVGEVPTINNAYRRARAKAHPDRNGGDRALWDQVEEAAAVLGLAGAR